jgi:hypothetical protein
MTRREQREAKAERLRDWADSNDGKADAARAGADAISSHIPFGQPILVGHHSEKRHRADIRRIESGHERSFEARAKADEQRQRADNIERAAAESIYSDDPDAVEQLREKVERLEAERERIKAYNRTCKAGQPNGDLSLLTDREKADLLATIRVTPYACKNGRFPPYKLTNLGGNINRARKRLTELSAPERGRWINARFESDCRECGRTVEAGERIFYFRRTRTIECESCATPPLAA